MTAPNPVQRRVKRALASDEMLPPAATEGSTFRDPAPDRGEPPEWAAWLWFIVIVLAVICASYLLASPFSRGSTLT